ncbi:unnamed protein product [Closterium sp. NIES-53]
MPGSGGTHRQVSPARDLSGVRELVTPRVRQAAKAALGSVQAPALLTSAVAGTENVGAGTSNPTALTPSVPLTKLLGGGGLTTALLLLALTTTGATPLCKAATSSATASASSATSSASAPSATSAASATSATSATATASSASTAAADTSTSASTPTTTTTPSTASTTTATAPLPLLVRRLPLGADAASTDSKPPRSAAAAEATEGKSGEGEHPSKIGVRGSPREAPTATMLVSVARRRSSRRSTVSEVGQTERKWSLTE